MRKKILACSYFINLVIIIFPLLLIGCGTTYYYYFIMHLPKSNPTQYIFPRPLEEIMKVFYDKFSADFSSFCFINDKDCGWENEKYLKTPENINDAIYRPTVNSRVYYNAEEPIRHSLIFHIHIISLSERTTLVEVRMIKSEIEIGEDNFHKLFPGHVSFVMKSVPPTTIEEYEILLKIGEGLGIKDQMPPIILPPK